jgi:mono/diheme cytochrome c family protein
VKAEPMTPGENAIPEKQGLAAMRLAWKITNLSAPTLAALLAMSTLPSRAQQPAAPAPENEQIDVAQLFATTCGWCHSAGGRAAGKGPQLMDSKRDDEFIRNRIKNGKEGAMPAFGPSFSDAQIDDIIKYIRALKPEG